MWKELSFQILNMAVRIVNTGLWRFRGMNYGIKKKRQSTAKDGYKKTNLNMRNSQK
jgi:hypothetical protein